MNCEACESKLADHATGRLDPASAEAVEHHLVACERCATFLDRVRGLYAIELDYAPEAPRELAFSPAATKSSVSLAAWVGLAAAVAATIAVALFALRDAPATADRAPESNEVTIATPRTEFVPVSISLELPTLPKSAPGAEWIEDREEARLVAEYSGKPLLEQFVCPCAGCDSVVRLLGDERFARRLDEFVRCRSTIGKGAVDVPERLSGKLIGPGLSLPAMFATDGTCSTEPVVSANTWEDVERVIADYAIDCAGEARDVSEALEGDAFARALEAMRALPKLLAAERFTDALEQLRSIEELGNRYRTRFAAEARRLEREFVTAIDAAFAHAEQLLREGGESAEEAHGIGRSLLRALEGSEYEARATALAS